MIFSAGEYDAGASFSFFSLNIKFNVINIVRLKEGRTLYLFQVVCKSPLMDDKKMI
jgi:hypothetical protein